MLMNFILYRKTFAWFKYVAVVLITIGVSAFMLFHPQESVKQSSNSLFGLFLLTINLLLDGTTNSSQDSIFHRFKISGAHMYFFYTNL
jgi:UDP-galactose transporter B1